MKGKQNIDINTLALSKGDVREFDKLYIAYYPKVKSFLISMLGSADDAEDLAQDTFINLWNGRKSLTKVINLNAYVYQSVKHVFFAYIRKRKEEFNTDLEAVNDHAATDDSESLVLVDELQALIDHVIEEMPPKRRLCFSMSRTEGKSIEEISKKLGISKRTVETHISMALSSLRKAICALLLLLYC